MIGLSRRGVVLPRLFLFPPAALAALELLELQAPLDTLGGLDGHDAHAALYGDGFFRRLLHIAQSRMEAFLTALQQVRSTQDKKKLRTRKDFS